jgi:hypothetical protein
MQLSNRDFTPSIRETESKRRCVIGKSTYKHYEDLPLFLKETQILFFLLVLWITEDAKIQR